MEAKNKAIELVEKFLNAHTISGGIGMNEKQAKQCALICVDEILVLLDKEGIVFGALFWEQVKQEIINLKQ